MNWLQKLMGSTTPAAPSTTVQTPDWLKKELRLPPWATLCEEHSHKLSSRIEVDMEAAYPEWLQLLGAPSNLTQYWIECAYQCIKLDVQAAIQGSALDIRSVGKPTEFHFLRAPAFALDKFPPGPIETITVDGVELKLRGVDLATRGRKAREHYRQVRGFLPFS